MDMSSENFRHSADPTPLPSLTKLFTFSPNAHPISSSQNSLPMGNKWRAPPQRQYFYKGKWTRRVDICFIDCLAWMAERGHKQLSYSSQDLEVVQFSMDLVNRVFRRKYTLKFLAHKLEFYRLRYSTFKTILAQPDFDWNPETNRLLAPKEAWDRVFRENLFAKAYWWRGEPKWGSLRAIFEEPTPHAAVFPQRVMLEAGPSTAGLKDDAGPSSGVRSTSVGPSMEPGRTEKRNCILVDTSDED